jgi:hypothetical protein
MIDPFDRLGAAAHTPDGAAQDLPEHQLGKSLLIHAHVISDDDPVDAKHRVAAHIDNFHGGRPILPLFGEP